MKFGVLPEAVQDEPLPQASMLWPLGRGSGCWRRIVYLDQPGLLNPGVTIRFCRGAGQNGNDALEFALSVAAASLLPGCWRRLSFIWISGAC
jgi:hypothetical protein